MLITLSHYCDVYKQTDDARDVMMKHAIGKDPKSRDPDDTDHAETHRCDLADMLSWVDQANCHPEHETGPAQGKEEW